jgi:SAM-dependent methyltransferase
MDAKLHWEHVYATRPVTSVGWFEADPATSRRLVDEAIARGARSVVDVGGGASRLVDHLLDRGLARVGVVDIAESGLDHARARLGERANRVAWLVGDVTALADLGSWDVWHDRAVFHFLLDPGKRGRYVALSERTVGKGGTAIMATFAPDGPERCSGLAVHRWSPEALAVECGPSWRLVASERHTHVTPTGVDQQYVYTTFRRVAA